MDGGCLKCYIDFLAFTQLHFFKGAAGNQADKVRGYVHCEIEGRAPIHNIGDSAAEGIASAGVEWLGRNENILRANRGVQLAPQVGSYRQFCALRAKDGCSITFVYYLTGEDISGHGKAGNELRVRLAKYLLRGSHLLYTPLTQDGNMVT